jgi:hypothetical protein
LQWRRQRQAVTSSKVLLDAVVVEKAEARNNIGVRGCGSSVLENKGAIVDIPNKYYH